ncbi:hypothetical protein O6H91_18G055600 [Diphasiastrum complanatum]|uniref:Uncharacterized protein n=2 Tax=Diphasiastrum complanatum TaxID=34168 RepID=A0ACC2B1E6_DIPCM|nr:hypothetical protein O6H91_18G055600 [Diphasiastrum complanatum]KAJ7523592.1 hypothetical protein O6H91_18G055600 [Diphasiastrum complanatum]
MENKGASIIQQISTLKQQLDQINEDIEKEISATRCIESETIRYREKTKDALEEEKEWMRKVICNENLYTDLCATSVALKKSLGGIAENLATMEKTRIELDIQIERERNEFINHCKKFEKSQGDFWTRLDKGMLCSTRRSLVQTLGSMKQEMEDVNDKAKVLVSDNATEKASMLREIEGRNVKLDLKNAIQHEASKNTSLMEEISNLNIALEDSKKTVGTPQ